MNKKRLAGLALVFPLFALCACGGGAPELALSSNWYKNTAATTALTGTREELIYSVSVAPPDTPRNFSVSYTDATYTATLSDETEQGKQIYRYETHFSATVQYSIGAAAGEALAESEDTVVRFLDVGNRLRPLSSTSAVQTSVPLYDDPAELKGAWALYRYTVTTVYDENGENATVTVDYADDTPDPEPFTVSVKGNGSYLDGLQIPFALRGLSMKDGFSFRSLNLMKKKTETVATSQTPEQTTEEGGFEYGYFGNEERLHTEDSIPACKAQIAYQANMAGQPLTLVYARKTSDIDNTYRNVMLRMEKPLQHTLGTLVYKLTSATFSAEL